MEDIQKKYWSMGEITDMFCTSETTIRNWCDWFNITPRRSSNNNRMFVAKELWRLKVIHVLLRVEGYTIRGAQKYLNLI